MTAEERDKLRQKCLFPNVHVNSGMLLDLLDENKWLRQGLEELVNPPCPTLSPGVHNALIRIVRKTLDKKFSQ